MTLGLKFFYFCIALPICISIFLFGTNSLLPPSMQYVPFELDAVIELNFGEGLFLTIGGFFMIIMVLLGLLTDMGKLRGEIRWHEIRR